MRTTVLKVENYTVKVEYNSFSLPFISLAGDNYALEFALTNYELKESQESRSRKLKTIQNFTTCVNVPIFQFFHPLALNFQSYALTVRNYSNDLNKNRASFHRYVYA